MNDRDSSEEKLGDLLDTVKPSLISVLIGCVPGGALCIFVAPFFQALLGQRPLPAERSVSIFFAVMSLVALFTLWMGLRHLRDRVHLYEKGFKYLGHTYLFSQISPVNWQRIGSGLTRFADVTHLNFTCQGKPVHLHTRYLQDLFYQYHKTYDTSLQSFEAREEERNR